MSLNGFPYCKLNVNTFFLFKKKLRHAGIYFVAIAAIDPSEDVQIQTATVSF